jgi:SAM-dependent methyltransferase
VRRRAVSGQARGVWDSFRGGHAAARALAVADSRSLVRSLFLASAVRLEVLPAMRTPQPVATLADSLGCTRPDRLVAWLHVGVELGELGHRDDGYVVRGRRAKALADGDPVLHAHYRSMLDYQAGVYADLDDLLRGGPDDGRPDLREHATVIAQVSLAAAAFVVPFLTRLVEERAPRAALDAGCGTGVYVRALLAADPHLAVDGVDLAADVIAEARADLERDGLGDRARLFVGDIRAWSPPSERRYGLVTLLNDIYYFEETERAALYGRLATLLDTDGELAIVTMTRTGSIAAAHLHLMLACQAGAASLPDADDVAADLVRAGYAVVEQQALVPTEPFVGIRARRLR